MMAYGGPLKSTFQVERKNMSTYQKDLETVIRQATVLIRANHGTAANLDKGVEEAIVAGDLVRAKRLRSLAKDEREIAAQWNYHRAKCIALRGPQA
jgi:hypothetical protein